MKKIPSIFKNPSFWLAMALLLGTVLRFYQLAYFSLWTNEAYSVDGAKKGLAEAVIWCAHDVHPPLYLAVLKYWILLAGDSEFSVRSLSVIFGVLTVYGVYRLGRLLYGRGAGVMAAYLAACSTFLIQYSQEARSYSLLAFLSVLSVYRFCLFLKKACRRNFIFLLMANAGLCYVHVFGLTVLAAEVVYFFLSLKKTMGRLKPYLILLLSNLLLFAPWLLVELHQAGTVRKTGYWMSYTGIHSMLNDILRTYAGGGDLFTFGVCVPLLIFGVIRFRRVPHGQSPAGPGQSISPDDREAVPGYLEPGLLLLVWLFVPVILCSILSVGVFPVYVKRNLIVGAPAFYILLSQGIRNLCARRTGLAAGVLVLLLGYVLFPAGGIEAFTHRPKSDWRGVVRFISGKAEAADVILAYHADKPLRYYYRGENQVIYLDDSGKSPVPDWDRQLTGRVERAKRLWVVYWRSVSFRQSFIRSLHDHLTRELNSTLILAQDDARYRDVGLLCYERKG